MSSSVETSSLTERYTGRVKWFNSKTGFGFVTVTDGPKSGTDVFVHHSSVQVGKEQYRYLIQGEYVQFELCAVRDGPHEFQAGNVTGVNGGQLMCESLLESGKQVRTYRPPQRRHTNDEPREETHRRRREASRESAPRETRTTESRPKTSDIKILTREGTRRTERDTGGRGRGRGRYVSER